MIRIEKVRIYGLEPAIRGMRNPLNSWDKSDSECCMIDSCACDCNECPYYGECDGKNIFDNDGYFIGPEDLKLAKKLSKLGPVHSKFKRMITVYVDVTAPLYWWKEYDTYKVGTVANSCSTMHKIHAKEFMIDDFSHEHLLNIPNPTDNDTEDPYDCVLTAVNVDGDVCYYGPTGFLKMSCDVLNHFRNLYLTTKDKKYWWQMIQLLPSSYNQKRTLMLNYEVLSNIYEYRKDHKLDEWREFCKWIETLPYSELITGDEKTV